MRSSWLIAAVAVAVFATASDSAWAFGGGRRGGCGGCGASACGGGCGGGRHFLGGRHRGGCGGCGNTGCGGCGGYAGCGSGCGGVYAGDFSVADFGTVADATPAEAAPSDAILVVHLPQNARLTVDDHATTSSADVRMFRTPELKEGTVYHYTLRAEITQDGKTRTVTRRVSIRRGEETHVNLDFATQVAAR